LEPTRFRLRVANGREQPDLTPRHVAAGERRGEKRQALEPRGDEREALKLPPRDAEPLSGIVADGRKAEPMMAADRREAHRSAADLAPRAGFAPSEGNRHVVRSPRRPVIRQRRVRRGFQRGRDRMKHGESLAKVIAAVNEEIESLRVDYSLAKP